MYLGLHWLFTALHGLSLLAESRGCSLVVASGFLTVLAPRRFSCCGARALSTGPVAVAHGFSCPATYGLFLDQGLNPCPLRWQSFNHWTTRDVLCILFKRTTS